MKMKIVVLDGYTLEPDRGLWKGIDRLGILTVHDRTAEDNLISRVKDAGIILTNKALITKEIMDQCPDLKYIGVLATGYDVVDIKAAKERNIVVTNVPDYSTNSVAQHTIAFLLELSHRIESHHHEVKKGTWTSSKDFCFYSHPLVELEGKTLGMVGFGKIGQRVAKIAEVLGMKILVSSRTIRPELETENIKFVDLDRLFKESDFISLHCPLTPETEGIINKGTIEKMKDGVRIINTARGKLIVEEDLKNSLETGKVGGAAVDVVSKEPIEADNPLLKANNIIITPHIAWATAESRKRLMDIAINNIKAFMEGDPINVVN